nr:hypothetical protein [Tanacetum cinerariifolium]
DSTIVGDTLVIGKVLELIMEDGPGCGLHFNFDGLQTKLLRHTGIVDSGSIFDDALSLFNTSMETNLLRITFNPHLTFTFNSQQEMDQQYPTVAKIPVLDTGKFEQWQFRIQQYLQHEHYALWEVIEFKDSYTVPANSPSTTTTDTTSGDAGTKSGRTVTLIAEDMQKKKNYVKARTTLLLSLSDEHQLRFKGSETLEQMFTRLQVIVGQLQFMDVEIEQDDLNQKFLTSLAPEWLMHTIVWRNRSDLDTMSLDDLCNHLKVYESEVQKKSEPNSQNMAFISSAKHSSGNEDGNTARVPTASASVATISQDTACAYIASQSSGSQIKFEDINQIDEDDIEEMDIKWNMALLSMRADKFWKNTVKKISIQGSDVAGFDKSKEEKEGVDGKLAGLLKASKDIDNLIESQRPSPTVESTSGDDQNRNPSVSETVASPITPKPFIKFVKPKDSKSKSKTGKIESPKKPPVKAVPRTILMTKVIGTVAALST